jgi:hypothetical protein
MSGRHPRGRGNLARAALAALLAAWLLLGPAAGAWAQGTRAKDYPPSPPPGLAPEEPAPPAGAPPLGAQPGKPGEAGTEQKKGKEKPLHSPLPPLEEAGTARPLPAKLPEAMRAFPALQLLAGSPQFSVHSGETDPETTLDSGHGFANGGLWGVDWTGEYLRAGYFRLLYRHDLPEGTQVKGNPADYLSFESNAFWAHGGFRPFPSLYAGLGLGVQQRRIRYELTNRESERVVDETVYSTGLLLEYALAPPFVVQLRYVHDLPGSHLDTDGPLILLAYTIPL